jgi:alpha-D-ribose 1-methylphosphonate 5-triphosphate diphosphatase
VLHLAGCRTLLPDGSIRPADIAIEHGRIAAIGAGSGATIDAGGLLALPGIVDIHGDAFERQIMPRPGVAFDLDLALVDTDRQLIANGITTALHALTVSWEPGLRSNETAVDFVAALERLAGRLACDTRLHVRWEAYNLDAVATVESWIAAGQVALLAFNDHTPAMLRRRGDVKQMTKYAERTGLSQEGFAALLEAVAARAVQVPGAVARLAGAARAAGIALASHDDVSPEMRAEYRALGVRIAEFPMTVETARAARAAGDSTIFGAPNVVRGGSHLGCPGAAEMIAAGACDILASDYYYPALHLAPFRLAKDGICPLGEAWRLVSTAPAAALGLGDRGTIEPGRRADLVLIDDSGAVPHIAGVFVAGRAAHLSGKLAQASPAALAQAAE